MSPNAIKDIAWMQTALRLAKRGYGQTSPNPVVGAVLVKGGKLIGKGWHHRAGEPHAEIEAMRDAQRHGQTPKGATLYVTLEPCCTHGRTPPCTKAILDAGIRRVVVGAIDPNPAHSGKGLRLLDRAGLQITKGILADEAKSLNEAFNHWIVHRTPFVTVKAAMSMDGKIATVTGESKWITGEAARRLGMQLREGADAILVGVNTILCDNSSLTLRPKTKQITRPVKPLRRIILDAYGRIPLESQIVRDAHASLTTIVVGPRAPRARVSALEQFVRIWTAPAKGGCIDLKWLLKKMGQENVTSLLVEGGGEVNASFLLGGWAQRIVFFYAPKILGGRNATKAVAGAGRTATKDWLRLRQVEWSRAGEDLVLTGRIEKPIQSI